MSAPDTRLDVRLVPMTRDHRTVVEWAARELSSVILEAEETNTGDPKDLAEVLRRIDDANAEYWPMGLGTVSGPWPAIHRIVPDPVVGSPVAPRSNT